MSVNNEHESGKLSKHENSAIEILLERGFTFLGKIGEGSYSTVYVTKYQPENAEKKVILACKVIDTKKTPKHFSKKFLPRELDILRKVRHPNIIRVHSIFAQHTKYFIFMNFASRGDLLTFIIKNGAIKEQQAYIWFHQTTDAVHYLHGMDIAHRDLKCENLLLNNKFIIKLSDFGFARSVRDEEGKHVKSKTFCGSVSYAPPELLSGVPYDPKQADMWSLGVVLFVMLNKAMPFDDTSVKRIYEHQVKHEYNFRPKVSNFLSDNVKDVVVKLLQPTVSERWTTEDILQCNWFKNTGTAILLLELNEGDTDESMYTDSWEPNAPSTSEVAKRPSSPVLHRRIKKNSLL